MSHISEIWDVSHGKDITFDDKLFEDLDERNRRFESLAKDLIVYGYNTGLGPLAEKRLPWDSLEDFQINIIRTHASSTGKPLPVPLVRGAMYMRIKHILSGSVGVRVEVVRRLIDFLNLKITPIVPEFGSVGASGDLSPYSHIALTLIGEGWVYLKNGNKVPSIVAHRMYGLEPLRLKPREALALINGYTFSLSNLGLVLYELRKLYDLMIGIFAISWKVVGGRKSPFNPEAVSAMNDKFAFEVSKDVWKNIEGYKEGNRVQDPYSIRCFPQVVGAFLRTLKFSEEVFNELYEGLSDNPIMVNDKIYSTGNFHGQAISLAADTLANAITTLIGFTERRVSFMLSEKSGLPFVLSDDPGRDSGYMMIQTSLASLFAESKVLSTPYSFQSLPTGIDQEDWVPMSFGATLRVLKLANLLLKTLAAEFVCGYKASKFLRIEEKICQEFEKTLPQYRKNLSLYEIWNLAEEFLKSKIGNWIEW